MMSILNESAIAARERIQDALPTLLGVLLALAALAVAGCGGAPEGDAFGNFEATDVTVSAQSDGRLVSFRIEEGDVLAAGEQVGVVDTTQLVAQRDNLLAQRTNLQAQRRALVVQSGATRSQIAEVRAGAQALAVQLETAEQELARTRRLHADGAATARELNEREGQVRQLREQLEQARARAASVGAQADVPEAQAEAIDGQIAALDAQLRQVQDRIDRAIVTNPTPGTVLSVIAREGETVMPGSPLYTVANLTTLRLRAYATGDQLPRLRPGMSVEVLVDDGNAGIETREGRVIWIASNAEFTPTPIQTRDERADLVYAFDVRVENPDGRLKVGMPGEVRFPDEED